MRILFHSASRRGLGHVMRAAAVIRAIQEREPRASCLLAVSRALPAGLLPPDISWVSTEPAAEGSSGVSRSAIADFGANLIVFDTVIPQDWRAFCAAAAGPRPARLALILREVRPQVLSDLRSHPIIDDLALIIIPHQREEFDPDLAHGVHVGPIVRLTGNVGADADGDGEMIDILTTAGGGGHRELCAAFFATAVAADRKLRSEGYCPRHVLVTGPRFDGASPASDGMTVRRFVPGLPRLMARTRVVVARAGYNTVAEILATGARAILVPGNPGLDDQRRRAERLAATGRVDVIEPGDSHGLATLLLRHLHACHAIASSELQPANASSSPDHLSSGARLAAAHLLSESQREGWR